MFREMRRKKQEISKEECVTILKSEKRGVLAVAGDEGYPYAIPMNFFYDEDEGKIYFHCAREGHKIDAVRRCEKVCFTVWNEGVQKDGDWAYYVTSVVVMGKAELVSDQSAAFAKVRELALKYYPTAEEAEAEVDRSAGRVQMIAVTIDHMTGKLVHEK